MISVRVRETTEILACFFQLRCLNMREVVMQMSFTFVEFHEFAPYIIKYGVHAGVPREL